MQGLKKKDTMSLKRKEINKENEDPGAISKKAKINNQTKLAKECMSSNKMSSKEAIKAFKAILKNSSASGEYSVSGEAKELPVLPGLHVKNIGPISLPLNETMANDLIKV